MPSNGKSQCERCPAAAEYNVHEPDASAPSGWRWANYCDDHVPAETIPSHR